MRYPQRSRFSLNNGGNSRDGSSRGGSRYNGNRRGGFSGGRGGGRGKQQPTFDPTSLILRTQREMPAVDQPDEVFVPTNSFVDFSLHSKLHSNIIARGYSQPSPIQDQAIPHILNNRDVVGIAQTGSGKTAAFLIPLINKVAMNPNERVLIVAPTRELAVQIRDEVRIFSRGLGFESSLCIGGASLFAQVQSLQKRPHFVIGTPGRLKDLEQRRKLNFVHFSSIVLDEVDRMLDMGFIHDVRYLIERLPQERHSLFFSATMDRKVSEIMQGFLNDPVSVTLRSKPSPRKINQDIVKLSGRSKMEVLESMLRTDGFEKVLVFGKTKRGAENISVKLQDRGFKAAAIHGNKSQGQRQRALQEFRNNRLQVLVATDVVSRGLDIDNVTHVINFDLPKTEEDYTHRIGRTGRADKSGVALTFVD